MNTLTAGTRVRVTSEYVKAGSKYLDDDKVLVGKVGTIARYGPFYAEVVLDVPAEYMANPYFFLPEELEAV